MAVTKSWQPKYLVKQTRYWLEIRSVGLLSTAASTMIGEGRSYKCQKTAAPALQPKALFSYCSTIYIDATFGG